MTRRLDVPGAGGAAQLGTAQTGVVIAVRGPGGVPGLAERILEQARALGVLGWVHENGEALTAHLEGAESSVSALLGFVREQASDHPAWTLQERRVAAEGHEQFAQRGLSAGVFVVQEHAATAHHFDFRLELDGVMRSWAVPKGPSLDPAVKRLAVEVEDHALAHNGFEGRLDRGGVIVWDRGTYEQRGRVPWPEALTRGHAVFALHGVKLRGGFALQRTRPGAKAQWLLIKRRDDAARPGSDVVAERPESVLSGRSLAALLRPSTPSDA
jgi:DNA ligase D-like protein (predicted 3'-phosphoesterase)